MTAALRVHEVTALDELRALREPWCELWRRVPTATPFQHPDWLLAYCEPFRIQQPWCLTLWRGSTLVGMAPLVVYARGHEQVATLLGAGISDHQDVLLDPHVSDAALPAIFEWLGSNQERWSVLEFEQLAPDSPFASVDPPADWRTHARAQDACPVLPLPRSVAELSHVVSPHLADNLRYYRRRAERKGMLTWETAMTATVDRLFDVLLHLHRACWEARGQAGVLPPPMEHFHRQVARAFAQQGLLRLHTLHIGRHVAAACYGFAAHGRAYYYLGGWDPACESLSPGTLVVGYAIEEAIRAGDQEFDFLRGRESYKYAWGARDRETVKRVLTAPALAREAAHGL